jgi:hypothetical protein
VRGWIGGVGRTSLGICHRQQVRPVHGFGPRHGLAMQNSRMDVVQPGGHPPRIRKQAGIARIPRRFCLAKNGNPSARRTPTRPPPPGIRRVGGVARIPRRFCPAKSGNPSARRTRPGLLRRRGDEHRGAPIPAKHQLTAVISARPIWPRSTNARSNLTSHLAETNRNLGGALTNAMREKLMQEGWQSPYRLRKQAVEPVFGQIKQGEASRT